MGLKQKLNKLMDFLFKFGIVALAFAIALVPVVFLLGHQTLHHQPWNDSMVQHSSRNAEIESVKALEISNIFLKEKGTISSSDVKNTLELADFVCYSLQSQGQAVVRRNIETKAGKKAKKGSGVKQIEGYKVAKTLHETPPLKSLKNKVAKFVDFQSDSLASKYWVVVVSGQFQSSIANEIKSISDSNEGYRFVIVSPTPVDHKILSEVPATEENAEEPEPQPEEEQAPQEQSEEVQETEEPQEVQEVQQQAEPQAEEESAAPEQEAKPQKKKKGKKSKSKKSKNGNEQEEDL